MIFSLQQYQTAVANEQREFQQFAERIAGTTCCDDYKFLHPLAQGFIKVSLHPVL